jgi:hypothetical protein
MNAQDDDARRRIQFVRASGDFNPAKFRHADIEDEQIWTMLFAQLRRFQSIGGLRDDEVPRRLEQAAQPSPHDGVIVSQ